MRIAFVSVVLVLSACSVAPDGESDVPAKELTGTVIAPADAPLLSWGFEPASPDCNGWRTNAATAIRAAPSRTGAYACKLCADGSAAELSLSHGVGAVAKGRYVVRAWLRNRADFTAPATVRVSLDDGSTTIMSSAEKNALEEWQSIESVVDLAENVTELRVAIRSAGATCVLVDDVVVERLIADR